MDPYKHQFVTSLVAYAVQRNVKASLLCNLSGIDLQRLRKKDHPQLSEKNFHDLWHNAIQLTDDPLFGLHFGESLQLSALGVVGQIIQSCKTIGEALTHACKSIGFITPLVSMEVTKTRKKIAICFYAEDRRMDGGVLALKQFIDFFMVFTIHELDGLTLQKLLPLKVSAPGVPEEHAAEYERVLRCRPTPSDNFVIEFDAAFWDEPIITANYELQKILLQMQEPPSTRAHSGLREKVTAYLRGNAYLGTATIEQIAANFNYTPRTLQRKLQEEGVTFRELTDEVRKALALRYLRVDKQPIKEVAFILGYNDASALSRAFKRWTGKAPASFAGNKSSH